MLEETVVGCPWYITVYWNYYYSLLDKKKFLFLILFNINSPKALHNQLEESLALLPTK